MSINSINIGFDMESMKCAANKTAKVDFVFDKGGDQTIFGGCKSISLMFQIVFPHTRTFSEEKTVFTYLLWIFLQKNWTSFSLFSSWSSMNLKERKNKNWMETMRMMNEGENVYRKDDEGSTSDRFFAKDDLTNRWRWLAWRLLWWWWGAAWRRWGRWYWGW